MRPQRTPAKTPRSRTTKSSLPTEPVKVFCRVRNLDCDADETCLEVTDSKTTRLTTSDGKTTEYQFSHVFDKNVVQPELFKTVCKPLVEGMIKGKSGLLFTYGVTSSGKTYTMTGTVDNPGILPRSLDMIFNSLENVQAKKYTFVPDGMNGFNIQSPEDIMVMQHQKDILPKNTPIKTPNKNRNTVDVRYDIDYCKSDNINPDCRYAVFVSYVEIYNDYVYDLLEEVQYDPFQRPKPPQSKRLREDKSHNMFVYGGNEMEVKSTEDAFAVFKIGQERRRIAHTQLNAESSRSHSIFNIRIVQAPLDSMGEDLLQEKSLICISQLALVDLAGSERTSRTRAGGERLREAGNINSSLMTLRRCLEQLRENQKNNGNELVKYRNSKVTYLFKNFFEGRGQVKMIICVNPRLQEADENFYVMQFAEMAQQVEVARQEEFKVDKESIRKQAEEEKRRKEELRRKEMSAANKLNGELSGNSMFQRGRRNCRRNLSTTSMSSDTTTDSDTVPMWARPNWNFEPLPSTEIIDYNDCDTLTNFIDALSRRIERRDSIEKDLNKMFAQTLMSITTTTEKECEQQMKLNECKMELDSKTKENIRLEKQVKKMENKIIVLQRTKDVYEKDKTSLKDELTRKELLLKESQTDNRKLESRMRGAVANTKAQYEKEMGNKVRNAKLQLQEQILMKDEKLKQLKSIMSETRTSRRFTPGSLSSVPSESSIGSAQKRLAHKRRSRSVENLLAPEKEKPSLNKSRQISNSDYNLRNHNKYSKKSISTTSTVTIDSAEDEYYNNRIVTKKTQTPTHSPLKHFERGEGSPCNKRLRSCGCCYGNGTKNYSDSELDSLLFEQENPINMGCKYVNRNDEDKQRFRPALPVAPKHRRSKSGTSNWLAHKPVDTLQTDTILQPHIRPNKVTHNPSPKDIRNAQKYLLTHQKEDKDGEIETQLIKGDVVRTRTGGQQVHFNDIEILKQQDPNRKKSPPNKRKSDVAMEELSQDEQSSWTDVETRCSTAIEHRVGSTAGPTIRNYPKRNKK